MSAAVTKRLPTQFREASLDPATYRAEENTIEVTWTTGVRRRAYDWWTDTAYEEELVVSADAVDMSRFEAGAVQVIDNHRTYGGVGAILGIAQRGWITGGEGRALIRLSQRDELAGVVRDIAAGIIRNISVGYTVERYEITRAIDRTDGSKLPLYRAVRWTPAEISFVTVPADALAGTRSQQPEQGHPCEIVSANTRQGKHVMEAAEIQALETRAQIRDLVTRQGLSLKFAESMIERGFDLERAREATLNALASRDEQSGGHVGARRADPPRGGVDEIIRLGAEAHAERYGARASDEANWLRGSTVLGVGAELAQARGLSTAGLSPAGVFSLITRNSLTASDFANFLQATGNRVLRNEHQVYDGGIKRAFKKSTARDFRDKQNLLLGEAPTLLKVNEAGEFTHGAMAEMKEAYRMVTYGRIVSLSRQAIINDDLGAFFTLVRKMMMAAQELESKILVNLLVSNPTMSDSVALFHATHGNLGTGAGSALQESSLSAARTAMRLQKGLDGVTPIDATPTYLITPAALETTAQKLLAVIQPTSVASVNPFSGALQLVVDPRLDAASATAWYLAASPERLDTIEYSYLEGEEGPQITIEEGFDVAGVRTRVHLDFGAGVLDFRGLYKANGA